MFFLHGIVLSKFTLLVQTVTERTSQAELSKIFLENHDKKHERVFRQISLMRYPMKLIQISFKSYPAKDNFSGRQMSTECLMEEIQPAVLSFTFETNHMTM